jgi:hypothetical protein
MARLRALDAALNSLPVAAYEGRLVQRAVAERFRGSAASIGRQLERTLDAVLPPLSEACRPLQAVAAATCLRACSNAC